MKVKTCRPVADCVRSISSLGAAAVLGVLVCSGYAQGQQTQRPANLISPRVKTYVGEHWNNASFSQGVAIMADTKETPTSRAAAMVTLHSNRRKLSGAEMMTFLGEVTRLAKDVSLDETNSAFAVGIMANLALTMRDQGQLSEAESKQEAGFLMTMATDSQRNVQLRASAINALGILKVVESRGALREMLTNSASSNLAEIVRPTCLSLIRIDGERAIPDLTGVLKKTSDVRIFGTAAFALGQVKKPESVTALVESLERFPDSGSCDAALVDMSDVIYGVLADARNVNLSAAIQSTRYLWREGQQEIYMPLLRDLLSNAPLSARKVAIERMIDSASRMDFESEKRELALVSKAIGNQPELEEYQVRIRSRLSASVLAPNANSTIAVPSTLKVGGIK